MTKIILLLAFPVLLLVGCQKSDQLQMESAADGPVYGLDMVENGSLSYGLYCVSCHGVGGEGDGPVAPELITKPTDLTLLSAKYDGVYPSTEVYDYIDGRKNVAAHGTRMMPVWGNIWTEHQGEDMVDLRIREIVDYIETLQVEE